LCLISVLEQKKINIEMNFIIFKKFELYLLKNNQTLAIDIAYVVFLSSKPITWQKRRKRSRRNQDPVPKL
jgi:hypothetical protein